VVKTRLPITAGEVILHVGSVTQPHIVNITR